MQKKLIVIGLITLFLISTIQISAIQSNNFIKYTERIDSTLINNPESIYILIKENIYNELEDHLDVFLQDLNNENYEVYFHQIPNDYSYENHIDIKSILQEGYQNDNLVGCIFVGDIPYIYVFGDNKFISDVYYMDLDGEWIDEDDNGIYEAHSSDKNLEIWIGRFWTQNGGNDIELLKNYFRKNHAYRSGNLILPKRALYYETRWDEWHDPDIEEVYLNNLNLIYDDVTFVAPWDGDPSPNDYLNKLQEGYEFVYMHSWSTSLRHDFINGKVYYYDITETDPQVFFYLLSACNVANIEKSNFIAGSYIFSESYGLTAVAPTTSSYDHPVWIYSDFVEPLKNGDCIGESFQNNYNTMMGECSDICSLYSHIIIGDPSFTIAKTYGPAPENIPPSIPTIHGPENGNIEEIHFYNLSSADADLDRVSFYIEWGDGTSNMTEDFIQSGSIKSIGHRWDAKGTYEIKVKAIDEHRAESDWQTLEVSMPKKNSIDHFLFDFYNKFLDTFPILQFLLEVKELNKLC